MEMQGGVGGVECGWHGGGRGAGFRFFGKPVLWGENPVANGRFTGGRVGEVNDAGHESDAPLDEARRDWWKLGWFFCLAQRHEGAKGCLGDRFGAFLGKQGALSVVEGCLLC